MLGTGTSLVVGLGGLGIGSVLLSTCRTATKCASHPGPQAQEEGVVGDEHHQNQHHGVHQHPEVGELAQHLGQYGEGGGGDNGTPHIAQSSQHHEDQDEDGGVEVELAGGEGGHAVAEQGARRPRQGGGGDEGHELVLGDVQPHALGGDAVVPQGHDGPARAAVHQVENDEQSDQNENKARGKGGYLRDAPDAHRALDQHLAPLAQIQPGGIVQQHAEPQSALGGLAQVEVVDDALDDLAEGQGDDGEVVAVEAQHGDAHQQPRDPRTDSPRHHGDGKAERRRGDGALKAYGRDHAGEGAHAHEACVAQGELAQDAHRQVQG